MPGRERKPNRKSGPTPLPKKPLRAASSDRFSSPEAKGRVLTWKTNVPMSTVVEDTLKYEGFSVVGTEDQKAMKKRLSMEVDHGNPDLVLSWGSQVLDNSDARGGRGNFLESPDPCLWRPARRAQGRKSGARMVPAIVLVAEALWQRGDGAGTVADAMRCN